MNPPLYKVIFQGKCLPGNRQENVSTRLAVILKTEKELISPIFNKLNWLIAKNVDFETAKSLERSFKGAGAQCKVRPVFPPKERAELSDVRNLEFFFFQAYSFSPQIFSLPRPVEVTNEESLPVFKIISKKPVVGRLLALLITALITFWLQNQLTFALAERMGPNGSVTMISILFYFSFLYFFYSILTGKKHLMFFLYSQPDRPFMQMLRKKKYIFRYDSYTVLGKNGEIVGSVKKDIYKKTWEAYDENGNPVYVAEKHLELIGIVADAALSLGTMLIKSKILNVIDRWIPAFGRLTLDTYFVKDMNEQVIAEFRKQKNYELKITDESETNRNILLIIAFSLFLAGL